MKKRHYLRDGDVAYIGDIPVPFNRSTGRFDYSKVDPELLRSGCLDLKKDGKPIWYAVDLPDGDPLKNMPYIEG